MTEPRDVEGAGRGAAESGSGEDEVVIMRGEEELVIRKRPVVKEVLKIRRVVVEEAKVVEADVRREEVEVLDETERGIGRSGT